MRLIKVNDARGATYVLQALEGCRATARMIDSLPVAKATRQQLDGLDVTLPGA